MTPYFIIILLLYFYATCCGVEFHNARGEQSLDVAAANHLLGGEDVQLGWRYERYGVAERECYV